MATRVDLVTPAFNEASNLAALHERLTASLDRLGVDWRWILVDDHSSDTTFDVLREIARKDSRVGGVRLSRKSGSHLAIACGLHHATAEAVIVLASDLQDPPEVVAGLVEQWMHGAQVVWAVRRERPGERGSMRAFARLYYWLMRRVVGLREIPAAGSGFFLLDRRVVEAFRAFRERNTSVLALFSWMGFRQAFIEYDKQPRRHGKSGWTLRKKLTLVVDSVTAFSGAPLALAGWAGVTSLTLGVFVAACTAFGLSLSSAWTLPVVLSLGGLQLLALAVAGAYLWRALDESRARPAWMVENSINIEVRHIPGGEAIAP